MTIRDLHDEHEREFAASALEVLVDQAMGGCPLPNDAVENLRKVLTMALHDYIRVEQRITWAAEINPDILSFEAFTALHIGD